MFPSAKVKTAYSYQTELKIFQLESLELCHSQYKYNYNISFIPYITVINWTAAELERI